MDFDLTHTTHFEYEGPVHESAMELRLEPRADGGQTLLGGRRITVRRKAAYLDDGTLAGSTLTMDAAFRALVEGMGFSLVDAAVMCATTPARELGLVGHGVLAVDAVADVVVLDASLSVVQTYVGGELVYSAR